MNLNIITETSLKEKITFISVKTREKAIQKAFEYKNLSWSDPISSFMITAFNLKTIRNLNTLFEEESKTYKEGQRFIVKENNFEKGLYSNELGFLIEEDGQKFIQTDHGLHQIDDNFKPAFAISPYHFPRDGFKNLVIIFEENNLNEINYNILKKIISKIEKRIVIITTEKAIKQLQTTLNI